MLDSIADLLGSLRTGEPATTSASGGLRLRSTVAPPASTEEIDRAWAGRRTPPLLRELWRAARSADLFVDVDYGQWGLRLFGPPRSKEETDRVRQGRPSDFGEGDVVIGEFLGDSDLLVVERDGVVRVAWPLDPRADWPTVANDLSAFLLRYRDTEGAKYWEHPVE